jgi:hypothetical protein
MAITYSLAPNPKWYIADKVGRPLGAGYLATFSNLDHTLLNPVYTDASGNFPWPYIDIPHTDIVGILFDENGSQGPFYFKFDSSLPDNLYYLEVYDKDGVLQWTIDDFSGGTGGGGGTVTNYININNLVSNNIMLRSNVGVTPIATSTFLKIAPGAHSGLAQTASNAGPDIVFLKTNLTATDTLSMPLFDQGEKFPNGEPTPINYLHYVCSVAGTGETQKCVQFPITHGVQNIQDQAVTVSIFARCTAGNANLTLNWMQFFGDGPAASSPAVAVSPIQTLTLSSAWQKFVIIPPGANVPDTTGLTIGQCGNDGLFLQVSYPLTATTTIDFTQPSAYMGSIVPGVNFVPNDQIEAVMYSPRTGYTVQGLDTETMGGYVPMNDGTIGALGSGATTRANIDTFPLYNMLYTNVINTWAPVSGGRTGNAINDFVAGKTIKLTRALGRVLGTYGSGAGLTARVLGEFLGEETHTLILGEMPAHQHGPPAGTLGYRSQVAAGGTLNEQAGTLDAIGLATGSTGGGGAHNNMQPSGFVATFIKL